MAFLLTDEQTQIADAARRFVEQSASTSRLRELRAEAPAIGSAERAPDGVAAQANRWDRDVWRRIADLGWLGLTVSEQAGGLGLGLSEVVLVVEALGRHLAPEPFLPSASLAVGTVAVLPAPPAWLEAALEGRTTAALVVGANGEVDGPAAVHAGRSGDGWTLRGAARHVVGGAFADRFVVVARGAGAPTALFDVDADAPGVVRRPEQRVDTWDAATIELVDVTAAAPLAVGDAADAALGRALAETRVAAGAYALGAATRAFDLTLEYVRQREQFGVPIGSFQALQHRLATAFAKIELGRSAVMAAARSADERAPDAGKLSLLAKVKACEALELAAKEGIQMHGGVGMTDEYDIGMYLKAHRGLDAWLGDGEALRARWATLSGY